MIVRNHCAYPDKSFAYSPAVALNLIPVDSKWYSTVSALISGRFTVRCTMFCTSTRQGAIR